LGKGGGISTEKKESQGGMEGPGKQLLCARKQRGKGDFEQKHTA